MMVLRLVLSTVLFLVVAALPPCDDARRLSGSPCDPQTAPPTAAPTQAPQPALHVEPVCLQPEDKDFTQAPGAFKPWVAYKYLKANAPFVTTVSKDLMGGQTLQIKNAEKPIEVANFKCVKEDNEWKARIKTEALLNDTLTIRLLDGWCDAWDVVTLGPKPLHCFDAIEECLLQDISLYRSMDDMLGLRFDYGHCPTTAGIKRPGPKQATIMIGLKRVPTHQMSNSAAAGVPNVRGFFEDLCHTRNPLATPEETSLDLKKAKHPNVQGSCFAASADSVDVSALNQLHNLPCFNDFRVYTLLDVINRYPVLPVMDVDYAWLLSKLPVARNPQDSPGAKVNQAKAMFGAVKMDRVCVHFEGLQDVSCKNTCGKVCTDSRIDTTPTTPGPAIPPALCLDCESAEMLYALIATVTVVMLSYYTYLANSMSWETMWFFVPLPGKPHENFNVLDSKHHSVRHTDVNKKLHWPAFLGIFFIAGFWSFVTYYTINLFDMLICWLGEMEQCIRLWPFQYWFDEAHYMSVNGTFAAFHTQHLTIDEAGRWILPWVGPRKMINIDWCPARLLGMIVATWFSTWFLMCWWRMEQKVAIMKTTIKQETIVEESGMFFPMVAVGGTQNGAGGKLTESLAFFGGQHVPAE